MDWIYSDSPHAPVVGCCNNMAMKFRVFLKFGEFDRLSFWRRLCSILVNNGLKPCFVHVVLNDVVERSAFRIQESLGKFSDWTPPSWLCVCVCVCVQANARAETQLGPTLLAIFLQLCSELHNIQRCQATLWQRSTILHMWNIREVPVAISNVHKLRS